MAKLTPKQEAFCQAVCDGMNQSDAYRHAYSAEKMKPETVQNTAYNLMQNREVTARIQELRGKLEKRVLITREDVLQGILDGIETGKANNKPMEIFKGYEIINKMLGYDAPIKHDVKSTGGFSINIVTTKKDLENE
jgi:phage terminase small subunit